MERNIEKATATGALNSSMSLAVAMGPIFGGFLSQLYGFKSTMFIGCALSIIASIIFLMMNSKN
jgi:predicted MFS family arabinose efflux permease